MTDDRYGSSSSDDLLREARQRVLDGELYSDDHLEASDEPHTSTSGGTPSDDGEELSAAEIAAQLAEARDAEKPEPEEPAAPEDPREDEYPSRQTSGMNSLPDWELDDEPSPPAG